MLNSTINLVLDFTGDGCRHLSPFAKIVFVMALDIGISWAAIVGLIFLDGFDLFGAERPSRRKVGKWLLAYSAICYVLVFAMPFLRFC